MNSNTQSQEQAEGAYVLLDFVDGALFGNWKRKRRNNKKYNPCLEIMCRHRGISQGKASQGKFLNVFISLFSKLFLKSKSLILFKLNKFMDAIKKNPPPATTNAV